MYISSMCFYQGAKPYLLREKEREREEKREVYLLRKQSTHTRKFIVILLNYRKRIHLDLNQSSSGEVCLPAHCYGYSASSLQLSNFTGSGQ